ncbi:MAG TPA: Ldh family oxidoreductase [Candidatus Acidoferrum sp.]|nr:Ldh family oxidoreductase [Candidatus Acidoferrum sp.]
MRRVQADDLRALVARACETMGARPEDAQQMAACLVRANLCGYDSHGVYRLGQYHEWWRRGLLDPAGRPCLMAEQGFAARVDGRRAFGQIVASYATQVAIAKAKAGGIAIVTAMNSNHMGRLADYAETLKAAGLIGLLSVNDAGAGQSVVPWGGMEPRLSTNPIAMGVPGADGPGILFDFSTSAAAFGKVRQLWMRGQPAPPGWLVDSAGSPTTDPSTLFTEPHGFLLPAGGHRGFALSLAVEVLSGILSGAGCANPHPGPEEFNGLFVLAIDPGWFMPPEQFRAEVDRLSAYVKSAKPQPGGEPVHIPGEQSRAEALRRASEGIPLDDKTCALLAEVLTSLGLPAELPSQ